MRLLLCLDYVLLLPVLNVLAGISDVQITTISSPYEEKTLNRFVRIIFIFAIIAAEPWQKNCPRPDIVRVKEDKVAHLGYIFLLSRLFSCGAHFV